MKKRFVLSPLEFSLERITYRYANNFKENNGLILHDCTAPNIDMIIPCSWMPNTNDDAMLLIRNHEGETCFWREESGTYVIYE